MASTIHSAARTGNFDKIQAFLKKGINVNAQDEAHGQTALIYASALGYVEVVWILLQHGAEVNIANRVGYSPLMAAARNCRHQCVKLLLDAGAEVAATDERGLTALMYAANFGLPETVELLLVHGADINAASMHGFTPLMAAAIHNSIPEEMIEETITLLLKAGADTQATANGKSAADFACEQGYAERAKRLTL